MIDLPPWRSDRTRRAVLAAATLPVLLFSATALRSDEPYARTRDYDLQHSRIALRFDLAQRSVLGDVTHTVSILREGTSKVAFDSVGLIIQSVSVNKSLAKFETAPTKLVVALPAASHPGDKFEIEVRYQARPTKGLYFILPDKDYPNRPAQIWTQGESEDTRYYLPTYDYPNDRLTTETVLTVPASWTTVANGKLISVTDAGNAMKTWTWRESVLSSTYLITVVAGEFDEVKDSLSGLPVTYYAPKGRGDRIRINYGRTPEMISLFAKKTGVDYPWEKYSQAMVDDFVAEGMENSSATTNTAESLKNPKLVPEYPTDEDALISHELAHQWFGDLVTCKDWGDIWLNEGFATFFETLWTESHYSKDEAAYERWTGMREWFTYSNLFARPMVRFDFDDSSEFDNNVYDKGGWVLFMLRHQIGEEAFWGGLHHYLEVNRGKNVVTADLIKAIEEANHIDIDRFFNQWVYGAGAPKFDLSYTFNESRHQVALKVTQTQKVEGHVGIFDVPIDVEITTASGPKLYPITVSKETETFVFPAGSPPLMVLFDKGGYILKTADFRKEKKEWLYQLNNAVEFSDRAESAIALGRIKNDDEVIVALGNALNTDKAPGIRTVSAGALGRIGGPAAFKQLVDALNTNNDPVVRFHIASALGYFKEEPEAAAKLETIAGQDRSYRARASALQALGRLRSPNAFSILTAAVATDSPDGYLCNAALRSFGSLGEIKAVPLLREWVSLGKPFDSREAALSSLARLDKDNKEITRQIASYLTEPHFPIRMAAIYALGNRGDASAVPALQALLTDDDLSIEMTPMIKEQIAKLEKRSAGKSHPTGDSDADDADDEKEGPSNEQAEISRRLDKLEHLVQEMNERLKAIESRLPSVPKQ
jgi:aminopeptidase N